ncbi:zinc finger protein 425-like [Trichogramma pretiosum]|uniref:zinc finger protein 425-like n=1 Tax=Trichogramma pretiosum TaxID=7493 RepID=UPI0006C96762|nr:zinc finger protein 425-like [Trichogramma pretiosum]
MIRKRRCSKVEMERIEISERDERDEEMKNQGSSSIANNEGKNIPAVSSNLVNVRKMILQLASVRVLVEKLPQNMVIKNWESSIVDLNKKHLYRTPLHLLCVNCDKIAQVQDDSCEKTDCDECKLKLVYEIQECRLPNKHKKTEDCDCKINTFYCPDCLEKSISKKKILDHVKRHDFESSKDGSKKLYCSGCKITSSYNIWKYLEGCEKCKETLHLQCGKCGNLFFNLREMKNHMLSNCYNTKKYRCTDCGYCVPRKGLIVLHRKRNKGHKYYITEYEENIIKEECDDDLSVIDQSANVTFSAHETLESNATANSSLTDYLSMDDIVEHVKQKDLPYACPECDKVFAYKKIMEKHLYLCRVITNVQCKQCTFVARNRKELKKHKYEVHQRISGRHKQDSYIRSICPKCQVPRTTKDLLKCPICKSKLQFRCIKCNKYQSLKKQLPCKHMREFSKLNLHECEMCSRGFIMRSNLLMHKQLCYPKIPKQEPIDEPQEED